MIKLSNISSYLVNGDIPLREALLRLNQSEVPFLLVVNTKRQLLGTVTDGDIRRGVLGGAKLDDPLSACVHLKPLTAREDEADLSALLRRVAFVPIVNGGNQVIGVALRDTVDPDVSDAVVMAGGLGTRLGSLTKAVPKPLLPVAGRPILEHILTSLEAAGVRRIWITVNHLSEQIERFARDREGLAKLEILHERARLGTAGGIGLLGERPLGPFFVVNGDVLTETDFRAMAAFHRKHGYDGTIAVAHHQVKVPFGVIRHESGIFAGIDEKPVIRQFVAGGIYLFGPEVLAMVPPNQPLDMPDLLNDAHSIGLRLGLFPIHEYWTDVGHPEDLKAADERHRRGGNDD
jgi:dTDP-glucose pyrophosphorylase